MEMNLRQRILRKIAGFGLLFLGGYFLLLGVFWHEITKVIVLRFLLGVLGVVLVTPGWRLVTAKPADEQRSAGKRAP